jgi:biopolymer transport protein TolR
MAFTSRYNGSARTQTALAEINITPLVDVVLVLLLIFMLTAPVLQSGLDVAIPKTRSVNQLKDQNVFLEDKPVNVNELPAKLKSGVTGPHSIVYVRSDQRVPFGAFASVMDAIKLAGITNISIVTRPIEH